MTNRPKHMATPEVDMEPRIAAEAGEAPTDLAEDVVAEEGMAASVGRNASLMSALVIVSRLTGFFRTWGQAFAVGATVMASCYSVANNLPNQLYELVVAGMLTTAFLPVYMSVKKRAGLKAACEYTSNLVSIILVLMGAVAILGFVFAAPLVYTQSFSANADFDFDLAVYFFRFFVIEVVLYALSTIFSGVLNAERDYFWSSAAPIFNNFVTTASFVAYAFLVGSNPGLALVILALGNPLGVLVQVLVQMPSMHRHGIRLRFHIDLRDPALRDTVAIGIPSLVVMAVTFVTSSVQSSSQLLASASGASVASYARLWYTLPYAILTVPITTAMFTELSDLWAREDMPAFKRGISTGMGQILYFMVPFAMYLCVFSMPLVSVISAGKFTPEQLRMTASYLCGLAFALPFYGICMYLQKVCSAMRRMVLYAVSSCLGSALQIVVLLWLTPVLGLTFVALSSAIFFIVVDIFMFANLRRSLGGIGLRSVARAFAAALVLGVAGSAAGWGIMRLLAGVMGPCDGRTGLSLLFCVLAGIPSVVVTYGLGILLKVPESSVIRSLLRRLVRR